MTQEEHHAKLRTYCLPLFVPQRIGDLNGGVSLEGTASVLEVGDDTFLLTATHVLETAQTTHLLYPADEGGLASTLGSLSLRFDPSQHEYDIGVVHLAGPAPRSDVSRLRLDDLYLGDTPQEVLLIGCGYPYSQNKPKNRPRNFRNRCYSIEWPALDHEAYESVGLNPNHHVALDHNFRARPNKKHVPKLVGMSGGAIWTGIEGRDQVVGVIQYHDSEKRADQQAVYGTKVTLALAAIAHVFEHLAPYIPVDPMHKDLIRRGRGT